MGTLYSPDCNNALTLILPAPVPRHSQYLHSLWHPPAGLRLVPWCSFIPKLGVEPGEEPLPIPTTEFIVTQYDKWAVLILSLLRGVSAGVTTRVAGLTTPLDIYKHFFNLRSSRISEGWLRPILPNRITGHLSTTKSKRIRFTNSRGSWSSSLPQGGMLLLRQLAGCGKRQDLTTPDGSQKM